VLKQDTFSFLPDLEWLELKSNRVDSIEPGAFNSLTKLRRLEITDNINNNCGGLTDKICGACPPLIELVNVEFLKLSSNFVKSVDGLFAGMASDAVNTKLRVLDLSNNKLTSLKANAFSCLGALTRLDLHQNFIRVVEEGAFSGLLNLRELTFSRRDSLYNSLDLAVFGNEPDLANLRFLDLSDYYSSHSIDSSVELCKLFAHCRHPVVVQAIEHYYSDGNFHFLNNVAQYGRIIFIPINVE
jgi:hypothetical protein